MKKSTQTLIAAAVLATSFAASADETATGIEPVYTTSTRTECSAAPSAGAPNWLGTSLGAILGAAGGSAVGKGKGNQIATASGAVIGSQVGSAITGNGDAQGRQECRQIVERQYAGVMVRTDRGNAVFVPSHLIQRMR